MFPDAEFQIPPNPGIIFPPKNFERWREVSQDYGPVAPQNISMGLNSHVWELFWVEGFWGIYRTDSPEETAQIVVDSQEVETPKFANLTWDTAGRAFIAWQTSTEALVIYWYDPQMGSFTTTQVSNEGKNPHVVLDLRSPEQFSDTDIILIYERANAVYYRISSNRFTAEYATPVTELGRRKIQRSGITHQRRFQIELA